MLISSSLNVSCECMQMSAVIYWHLHIITVSRRTEIYWPLYLLKGWLLLYPTQRSVQHSTQDCNHYLPKPVTAPSQSVIHSLVRAHYCHLQCILPRFLWHAEGILLCFAIHTDFFLFILFWPCQCNWGRKQELKSQNQFCFLKQALNHLF